MTVISSWREGVKEGEPFGGVSPERSSMTKRR